MTWDRYRLTPEMRERLAALGEISAAPPKGISQKRDMGRTGHPLTKKEIVRAVAKVRKFQAKGKTIVEACEAAGVAHGSFHRWKLIADGRIPMGPMRWKFTAAEMRPKVQAYEQFRSEGKTRAECCKLVGVSYTTIYKWRRIFGKMLKS